MRMFLPFHQRAERAYGLTIHIVSATTWRRTSWDQVKANIIVTVALIHRYSMSGLNFLERSGAHFHVRHAKPQKGPCKPQQRPKDGAAKRRVVHFACMRRVCMCVCAFICLNMRDADVLMCYLRKTTNCLGTQLDWVGGPKMLFPVTSVRRFHCLSSEARWLSAALNQATASVQMKTTVANISARSYDSSLSVQLKSASVSNGEPVGCPHLQSR